MKLRHLAIIGSLFPFLIAIVLFFGVDSAFLWCAYQCRGRRRGRWLFLMGNGHEPVRRGLETSAYGGEIRKGIRHIRVRPLSAGNHTGGKWRDRFGRYAEFREHGLTA